MLPANEAANDYGTLHKKKRPSRASSLRVPRNADLPVVAKKLKTRQNKRRGSNPSSLGKKKGKGAKSERAKSKGKKDKSNPQKQNVTLQLLIDFDAPRGAN